MDDHKTGLNTMQAFQKRLFDVIGSVIGLLLFGWVVVLAAALSRLDTGESGFFTHERVGRYGKIFRVIKIRTMRQTGVPETTVTTASDPRITRLGSFFRNTKIDEFPQLWNVFVGQMSFVGPRPDVLGFADRLSGDDKIILSVRPGITGPATLKYRNEESLLSSSPNPEKYNLEIIFPDKIKINRAYIENYTFLGDLGYIIKTIFG